MTKTLQIRIGLLSIATLMVAALTLPAIVSAQPAERGERGEQARVAAQERRRSVEEAREERVSDIQQKVQERRAQVQADVCERREDQLARMVPRLSTGSERLLAAMDNVYERVQGFYASGQLTVANYQELDEAVAAAQTEATASVEGLTEEFEFEFDCDNPSLGDQMFAFRESVADTRETLKDYRTQLVALISSLRAAAAEETEAATDQVDETNEADDINREEENDA